MLNSANGEEDSYTQASPEGDFYVLQDPDNDQTNEHGLLSINVANLYDYEPGNILHVWVQESNGTQEAQIDVELGYKDVEDFYGEADALYLVSNVISNPLPVNGGTVSYAFNGGRNNDRSCTVNITTPSTAAGSISVGLLDSNPVLPVPGQAEPLAFTFGTQNLTLSGTASFTIKLTWDGGTITETPENLPDIILESTNTSNQGLFISKDGRQWINTKNHNYTGITIGADDWDVSNSTGDFVEFEMNYIPNKIVLGDGGGTYTESTPDIPSGQQVELSSDTITLKWDKSTFPDADYIFEKSDDPYATNPSDWTSAGTTFSYDADNNKKYVTASIPTGNSYFYRVRAKNHSNQESDNCTPFGYCKYDLVSGWNMIAYALGEDGRKIKTLYNDPVGYNSNEYYGDIDNLDSDNAIKKWDFASQSWTTYENSSPTEVNKGDVLFVNLTASETWYSTGIVDNSAKPYQYTLDYQTGISGYNLVMIPFSKSDITTVAGLYDDIFGNSAPTDYKRTLSWYSATDAAYYTYEDGPISASSWNSEIKPGTPIIIHVKSGESITWPE